MWPWQEQIDPSILQVFTGSTPIEARSPWLEDSANLEFEADSNHTFTPRKHKQPVKPDIGRLTGVDLTCAHCRPV